MRRRKKVVAILTAAVLSLTSVFGGIAPKRTFAEEGQVQGVQIERVQVNLSANINGSYRELQGGTLNVSTGEELKINARVSFNVSTDGQFKPPQNIPVTISVDGQGEGVEIWSDNHGGDPNDPNNQNHGGDPNAPNNQNNGGDSNAPNNQNNGGDSNAPNNQNNGGDQNDPNNQNNGGGYSATEYFDLNNNVYNEDREVEHSFYIKGSSEGQVQFNVSVSVNGNGGQNRDFTVNFQKNGGGQQEEFAAKEGCTRVIFKASEDGEHGNRYYIRNGFSMILPECNFQAPYGQIFGGWEGGEPGDIYKPHNDPEIITAHWITPGENDTATVTISPGMGSGETNQYQVQKGQIYQFSDLTTYGITAPEGYTLYGWYVYDPDTHQMLYTTGEFTVLEDITLSPTWCMNDVNQYAVTYDPGEGTGTGMAHVINYPSGNDITLVDFKNYAQLGITAPEGYVFDHWALTETDTGNVIGTRKNLGKVFLDKNITATACYREKPANDIPNGFYLYRRSSNGVATNFIPACEYDGSAQDGVLGVNKGTTNTFNMSVKWDNIDYSEKVDYILEMAHGENRIKVYKNGTATVIANVSITDDQVSIEAVAPGEGEFNIEAVDSMGDFAYQASYRLVVSEIGSQDENSDAAAAVTAITCFNTTPVTIDDYMLEVTTGIVSAADGSEKTDASADIGEETIKSVMSNIVGMETELTEEEMTALSEGEAYLYIGADEVAESDVSEAAKTSIEGEVAWGTSVGEYMDVNLYAQLGNNERRAVSDTGIEETVDVTVTVDKNKGMPVGVIRYHDGVAEKLEDASVNPVFNGETLDGYDVTFGSSQFSTYAIVYSSLRTEQQEDDVASVTWRYSTNTSNDYIEFVTAYFEDIETALKAAGVNNFKDTLPENVQQSFGYYGPAKVKLLKDVAIDGTVVVDSDNTICLDLNAHNFTIKKNGVLSGMYDEYPTPVMIESSVPGTLDIYGRVELTIETWTGDNVNIIGGSIVNSFSVDGGNILIDGGDVNFGGYMINNGGDADITAIITGEAWISGLSYIVYLDENGEIPAGMHDIQLNIASGYFDVDPASYTVGQMGGDPYDQSAFVTYDADAVEEYDPDNPQADWKADPEIFKFRIKEEFICQHANITEHPAVEATCTKAGNSAYWSCSECGKYFLDGAGQTEIEENSWVIKAKGHNLTEHPAVEATCTKAGNSAYWSCSECGKYFLDGAGQTEIDENSWVIAAKGHNLTEHKAVDATCTKAGNSAYWSCSECGKYYSDSAGKTAITKNSWVIKAKGHNLTEHKAVAATCTKAGNSAYWSCSECGKYYSDSTGKTAITKNSWVISAKGHSYGSPTWSWTGTSSSVATFTCKNGCGHTEKRTATITNKVTTAATCTTKGVRTYTATVTFNDKNYKATKTAPIAAKGHNWGTPKWTWTGYTKAVATFTCKTDSSHTKKQNGTITYKVTTKATVTTAGVKTYTATVTLNEKTYKATKTKKIYVFDKAVTGLQKYNNVLYYAKNGVQYTSFTGFAKYGSDWYYVVKGKVDTSKNDVIKGTVNSKSGWWCIQKGKVNLSYNGFAKNSNGWWYCKNGMVDLNYKDVVKGTVNGETAWWFVSGGKVQFINSVEKNSLGWWCIQNGKVNFNFTGIASNSLGSWYCKGGQVQFGYSGKITYNGKTYTIKDGKVQ